MSLIGKTIEFRYINHKPAEKSNLGKGLVLDKVRMFSKDFNIVQDWFMIEGFKGNVNFIQPFKVVKIIHH